MIAGRTVWVVIPAFQEELLVATVVRGVPQEVDHIVVVDDASTDGTAASVRASACARTELVCHAANRGVGASIITGYQHFLAHCADARAVCVVMAGDNQMDPADLKGLIAAINDGADYAKGNRFATAAARQAMPALRWFGNVGLTIGTRVSTGLWRVADSQCGYTASTRAVLARIALGELYPRYGFPNDMLLHVALAQGRVADVPVRAVYAEERSKIRVLRVAPRIAALLVRGFWRRTGACSAPGWMLRGLWAAACAAFGGSIAAAVAATGTAGPLFLVGVSCAVAALLLDSLRCLQAPCVCSH